MSVYNRTNELEKLCRELYDALLLVLGVEALDPQEQVGVDDVIEKTERMLGISNPGSN